MTRLTKGAGLLLVVLFLMGVAGCMDAEDHDAQAQAEMLSYLEAKYEEEFSLKDYTPGGSGYTREVWDQGYAYAQDHEDRAFVVRRFPDEAGGGRLDDGYSYYLAEDAIQPGIEDVTHRVIEGSTTVVQLGSDTGASAYNYEGAFDLGSFLEAEAGGGSVIHVFAPASGASVIEQAEAVHVLGDELADDRRLTALGTTIVAVYYFEDGSDVPAVLPGRKIGPSEIARRIGASRCVRTRLDGGIQEYSTERILELVLELDEQ